MQTECPHCQTLFHVTDEQLQAADGQVRCGKCNAIFTAEVMPSPEAPVLDESEQAEWSIDDITIDELDDINVEVADIAIPDSFIAPELEPSELDNDALLITDYTSLDESKPGSELESEPGSELESEPGSELKSEPGSELESEPGSELESEPGSELESESGSELESNPGSELESESKSGSELESEPGSKLESEPAPADDSGNQPGLRLINTDKPDEDNTDQYPELAETQVSAVHIDTSRQAANQSEITGDNAGQTPLTQAATDESNDNQSIPVLHEEQAGYDPTQLYPELDTAAVAAPANITSYVITSLLLVLLFVGQGTYLLRDNLAAHGLRPLMESFCARLNCQLALPREPDSIIIKRREVRSHPNINNALSVQATITNQASFRQAYPLLQIQFHDIEGRIIAGRDFLPSQYLPQDINLNAGIAPSTPVNIALELIDPGSKAVSFLFIFK